MLSIIASASVKQTDFSTDDKLVSLSDNRSWITYLGSLCLTIHKEYKSRSERINNPFRLDAKRLFPILQANHSYSKDSQPWLIENSSRLVVLIHGLNSSPLSWSTYIQELDNDETSPHYFAPYVYKKGYCKLKESVEPIFHVIQNYARQYPDNPIILVGHSNGARITQDIERKIEARKIKLISIAAPHFGSKLVNWMAFFNLNSWLGISDSMSDELKYNSEWVNKKIVKWQKSSIEKEDKVVKRIFFASADDLRIFPNDTSFPRLPSSTYFLISGESHITIIDAVCHKVLAEALQ